LAKKKRKLVLTPVCNSYMQMALAPVYAVSERPLPIGHREIDKAAVSFSALWVNVLALYKRRGIVGGA
jgi:hypothetical protein